MSFVDSRFARAFRELREQDARQASRFEDSWARAGHHPTAAKPRRWLLRGAAAAAVLALAVYLFRPSPPSPISISEWRAPTDGLLTEPGSSLMRTTPRLGESLLKGTR